MEYTLQTDASLYSTSIVILTHNQLVHTQLCIQSIRDYTSDVDYEIIVIDNASTDGTREWLHAQPDLIVQENLINVGFPAGCNQGIQLATRNNILLLNNDTVVTSKWLKRMTEGLI
ncbi:glycosyltransferase family 2 protein [Ferroacidibacillus organovorans]|uniref:glycosyltransferase family 2 protein n=1 Tax=Ferroacidibacillus organovorans TaxID=1765683 RepID=UPI000AC88A00|nr:glycosyltransferase [Ferroacidibacillus organovorans]